ncbi:hypothetical protein GYMLUDRAFT_46930 [Collybiopsis luxurians FD-317 M1]|uniref:Uncharacterized protein n=1 Tax=Collybiopsis luxurians FD-317 M1 TaxID=944289 RepID=A0A0D0C2S0_9AGAR|nr:hypothetical protein GYMLUDRAFT_46930 [Collybiopsis luxurians FD-317 M1]
MIPVYQTQFLRGARRGGVAFDPLVGHEQPRQSCEGIKRGVFISTWFPHLLVSTQFSGRKIRHLETPSLSCVSIPSALSLSLISSLSHTQSLSPQTNDAQNHPNNIHVRATLQIHPEVNFEFHSPADIGLTPIPASDVGKLRNAVQLFLRSKSQNFFQFGSKGTRAQLNMPKYEGTPHVDEQGEVEFVVHLKGANGQSRCGEGDWCHVKMKKDGSAGEIHGSDEYGAEGGVKITRGFGSDEAW